MGGTSDVRIEAFVLFYQEEAVLSDRKRNQSLYLPLVLNQQPLPVNLDLDDLVSLKGSTVP